MPGREVLERVPTQRGFRLALDTLPSSRPEATRPPGPPRPLVYRAPLRGCGGTFTRERSALLGAQP